jgi:hypothetical protein
MKRIKRRITLWFVVAEGQPMVKLTLPYKDAKRAIEVTRAEIDILNGKPGFAGECGNSQTCLRLKDKFPHPVDLVQFTDTRAYFVELKSGVPVRCIRYEHSDDAFQKLFDSRGGRKKVIEAGYVGRTVELRPVSQQGSHSRVTKKGLEVHQPHTETGKQKRVVDVHKGSWARARRAGLLRFPQLEEAAN